MSDPIPDTPYLAIHWCPTCEPMRDPAAELLDVRYCPPHEPARGGIDDDLAPIYAYLSGSSEAGGDDNRRWCELFRRKKTLLRGPA